MDSEAFHAPPTTTAALTAYFRKYGSSSDATAIELVHFQGPEEISAWLKAWREQHLATAKAALAQGIQPVVGFSFYTWNAAEFLHIAEHIKTLLPRSEEHTSELQSRSDLV